MYLVGSKRIRAPWFVKLSGRLVQIVGTFYGLAFVFVFARGMYQSADEHGCFSHRRIVSVSMTRDWLPGEFKGCALGPNNTLRSEAGADSRMF
jgi:hypothetical protein